MKRRRKRIDEITEFVEDLVVDAAADKVADNIVDDSSEEEKEDEDAEDTMGTTTPIGNNGTAPAPQNNAAVAPQPEEKEEVDPEIEAMYKAVEELRNKQEETNQIGLLNQQNSQQLKQSADDIMKEIEAYIQQHKK